MREEPDRAVAGIASLDMALGGATVQEQEEFGRPNDPRRQGRRRLVIYTPIL